MYFIDIYVAMMDNIVLHIGKVLLHAELVVSPNTTNKSSKLLHKHFSLHRLSYLTS